MKVGLKGFFIGIEQNKADEFNTNLSELCQTYSGGAYAYAYDKKPETIRVNSTNEIIFYLEFSYFNIRIDEEDDESFLDRLDSLCTEYAYNGNEFGYQQENQ